MTRVRSAFPGWKSVAPPGTGKLKIAGGVERVRQSGLRLHDGPEGENGRVPAGKHDRRVRPPRIVRALLDTKNSRRPGMNGVAKFAVLI
jgi:hypothetical protein